MASLSQIKLSNATLKAENLPRTIVMAGATGGIGSATLLCLAEAAARADCSPMTVYLLGRNEAAHTTQLAAVRAIHPGMTLIWKECQLTLLADIRRACDEISTSITKNSQDDSNGSIDALYMAAGALPFKSQTSSEGLDTHLTLAYYGRMLMVAVLLPLLRRSSCAQGARVVCIMDTGSETASVPLDDLALRKSRNQTLLAYVQYIATYTTVGLSKLAATTTEEGKEVLMIHNHPGVVGTDILEKGWGTGVLPTLTRTIIKTVIMPTIRLVGLTTRDSGERCLFLLTSAAYGGKGQDLPKGIKEGTDVLGGKEWNRAWTVDKSFCTGRVERVMRQIFEKKVDEEIWKHTMDVIGMYIS